MTLRREVVTKSIFNLISKKSSFQKKKIDSFHKNLNRNDFREIEVYLKLYKKFLSKNKLSLENGVNSYHEMCTDMFNCHIKFLRTGRYPVQSLKEAKKNVYFNSVKMKSYMVGLAISQFFWETHYKMFKHLQKMILSKSKANSYLEIGPGHGLFSHFSLGVLNNLSDYTAIDISKTSLRLTKDFLKFSSKIDFNKIGNFINKDFLQLRDKKKYDLIVCGEVLEHVLNPINLLKNLTNRLEKNGRVFISTCANCPAIDHVNEFFSIEEIEKLFKKANLSVVSRKVLPVEKVSYKVALQKKITVNYSAILKHK